MMMMKNPPLLAEAAAASSPLPILRRRQHKRQKKRRRCMIVPSTTTTTTTQSSSLMMMVLLLLAVVVVSVLNNSCTCEASSSSSSSSFIFQRQQQRTAFISNNIERTNKKRNNSHSLKVQPGQNNDKPKLVPEENPDFDVMATSISGVRYSHVLQGLHRIFPPSSLDERNALSRSDGYWPYIRKGEDPPKQFTYGEFDFYFFGQLLDQAIEYYYNYNDGGQQQDEATNNNNWNDKVFVDIGSGTGRLVLSAAALHPNFKKCRGIELLEKIHLNAESNLESLKVGDNSMMISEADEYDSPQQYDIGEIIQLPMAPVEFVCGSFEDPYTYFGDADCIFVFSSCMPSDLLASLAKSIGRQCKPGTIVITTEYSLPLEGAIHPYENGDERVPSGQYKLELLEKVDGWCWLTGGESTAYIHRVQVGLNQPPLDKPKTKTSSIEDMAYEVAKMLDDGGLSPNPDEFKRGVYNNMAFYDLPFRPKPPEDEK